MSPEATTNRLKIMEQLLELSVGLMQAQKISDIDPSKKRHFENFGC